MLQEAIAHVHELGKRGREPKFIDVPGAPPHHKYFVDKDGEVKEVRIPPGNRRMVVRRFDDLVKLAQSHFDDNVRNAGRTLVTYNAGGIWLTFNYENGREAAILPLKPTAEYLFFEGAMKEPYFEVDALRTTLRFDIRKTFQNNKLIEQVSKIVFEKNQSSGVELASGKESLGSSVLEQVDQTVDLPNVKQVFNVCRWWHPDFNFRMNLECVLEPEVRGRVWMLRPYTDAWAEFNIQTLKKVGEKLREKLEETVPVIEGDIDFVTTA